MNRGQTAKTENVVFLTDFVTHGLVQPLFHHRRSFFSASLNNLFQENSFSTISCISLHLSHAFPLLHTEARYWHGVGELCV